MGIYGYPPLIDGGYVRRPVALYSLDGAWEVENNGVAPDFEVELDPKAGARATIRSWKPR